MKSTAFMIPMRLRLMMRGWTNGFKSGRKSSKKPLKPALNSKGLTSLNYPAQLTLEQVKIAADRQQPNFKRWQISGGRLNYSRKVRTRFLIHFPYLGNRAGASAEGINWLSLVYIALIPAVFIGYIVFADWSFNRKNKAYAIPTTSFATTVPTRGASYGFTVKPTRSAAAAGGEVSAARTAVPTEKNQPEFISSGGSPLVTIVVVTATPSPVPTITPNPYSTLHVTMTELWRLAYTATPYAATMNAAPQWNMKTGDCIKNCYFVTATAAPMRLPDGH